MANVTYILGAGASSNSLPTYQNFRERFLKFRDFFSKKNKLQNELVQEEQEAFDSISKSIENIDEEFNFHNTPDTIAKKYFHTDQDSHRLNTLKEILVLFFVHQQILKGSEEEDISIIEKKRQPLDKRYDSFIASLLKPKKGKLELFNQFKVLTWNYDLQFEITYSKYAQKELKSCQRYIQSYPQILSDDIIKFDKNQFAILHLNGIAYGESIINNSYKNFVGNFYNNDIHVLKHLTQMFISFRTSNENKKINSHGLLSFAWENQKEDSSIIENETLKAATDVAKDTEILIIVGYSFPIFNNHIDKFLISQMRGLRKIYIQSPTASDLKDMLTGDLLGKIDVREKEIIDLKYWSQFHIPVEWNKKLSPKKRIGSVAF